MGIYYKFASAKDFDVLPIDGCVISIAAFKRRIFESRYKSKKKSDSNGLCLGTDLDLMVINAQTNQQYDDNDNTLIPNHTSVLLRRVPGSRRRKPIDTHTIAFLKPQLPLSAADSRSAESTVTSLSSTNSISTVAGLNGADDEDSKIKALVNTPALDRQGIGRKTHPPQGYVCHRCNVAGHFIQHCPTNGDPNYDFKLRKPGAATVLLQNETAFDKLFQCAPSKRSSPDVPPELLCPLCKKIMRDAMLTSKCCFSSFCDECIRYHLTSSGLNCVCGATQVLADSLIPNITLRQAINRFSGSNSSGISAPKGASSGVISTADLHNKETKPSLESTDGMGNKRKHDDAHCSTAEKAKTKSGSLTTGEKASHQAAAEEVEEQQPKRIAVEGKVQRTSEKGKRKKEKKICNGNDVHSIYYHGGDGFTYTSFVMPYWGVQQH